MYVLESALILESGLTIPLLTEVLVNDEIAQSNNSGDDISEEQKKQDCETKAFKRLSVRLRKLLGKGSVTVVLDGLYASGPVISRCKAYNWEYMITLKRKSLKTVWSDFDGLRKIEKENELEAQWGDRSQAYCWSNDIEYIYGNNNKKLLLNIVTCTETWTEDQPRSHKKTKQCKIEFAWISSKRIKKENVFEICTQIARKRWYIENKSFHVEKNDGYNYSHCFSLNWEAMKGYHYLMKFAHMIDALIVCCKDVVDYVACEGVKGFTKKVWNILLMQGLRCAAEIKCDDIHANSRKRIKFKALQLSAPLSTAS